MTKKKASAAMRFEIEGEGEFDPQKHYPLVERVIRFLKALPDGKFLRIRKLAERTSVSQGALSHHVSRPELADYRCQMKGERGSYILYGNPKTIQAAREKFKL